jgi:hypothetical protein|tara:strand:- start:642 stop:1490 length:849 start_codon:yes stop_codon:yes gene_type:complete
MNKDLLPTELQDVLTEKSVEAIETALKEKVELSVEAALTSQDELYASKLEQLVERIDNNHAAKIKNIIEAVDSNNAAKLVKVVKKYEAELNSGAADFKETIVESISNYLEEFIEEAVPTADIQEATRNNTAARVLNNLRQTLAVDSALMAESVKSAIIDGKGEIDQLKADLATLKESNTNLQDNYNEAKAAVFLESRTSRFSNKKATYLKKVLSDKSPKFIEENFEYTSRLFDRKEKEQLEVIREEAISNRTVKADAPKLVVEKVEPSTPVNPYIQGLDKMK